MKDKQKNLSPKVQEIYFDLQTKENEKLLKNFGKSIAKFFNLLDGHLLKMLSDTKMSPLREITKEINRPFNFGKKNVQVYKTRIVYDIHWIKKNEKKEGETSVYFFKRVMMDNNESYYGNLQDTQTHYLFKHYFVIYNNLINQIIGELELFFKQKKAIFINNNIQKIIDRC